jgi:hypothetical protein
VAHLRWGDRQSGRQRGALRSQLREIAAKLDAPQYG